VFCWKETRYSRGMGALGRRFIFIFFAPDPANWLPASLLYTYMCVRVVDFQTRVSGFATAKGAAGLFGPDHWTKSCCGERETYPQKIMTTQSSCDFYPLALTASLRFLRRF
jgi:hypothetical protein